MQLYCTSPFCIKGYEDRMGDFVVPPELAPEALTELKKENRNENVCKLRRPHKVWEFLTI